MAAAMLFMHSRFTSSFVSITLDVHVIVDIGDIHAGVEVHAHEEDTHGDAAIVVDGMIGLKVNALGIVALRVLELTFGSFASSVHAFSSLLSLSLSSSNML